MTLVEKEDRELLALTICFGAIITGLPLLLAGANIEENAAKEDFYAKTEISSPSKEITILQLTGKKDQPQEKDIYRVIADGNTTVEVEANQQTAEDYIEAGILRKKLPGEQLKQIDGLVDVPELDNEKFESNDYNIHDYQIWPKATS